MTSTSIIVLAGDKQPIGAIEKLTIKESRDSSGTTTNVHLEVPRMRMARSRLNEYFDKGNFHVASQVYPVHIVVLEDKVEIIRATNAWISKIAVAFTTDEWIVAEGVEMECEFVTGTKTYDSSSDE